MDKYKTICPSFVNYFNKYYVPRKETWAMCYRDFPHANTDTNMYAEAFHNKLKTFYMDRRPNKRLDDLINLLLVIEEDDYWRHKRDAIYLNNVSSKAESNRHTKGMNITDISVEATSTPDQVLVNSQTHANLFYRVDRIQHTCSDDCLELCMDIACVGLCGKKYICNCDDSSTLCKHIHKLHSFLLRTGQCKNNIQTEEAPQYVLYHPMVDNDDINKEHEKLSEEEKFLNLVSTLTKLIKDPSVQALHLSSINRQLRDIVKQAEAVTNLNEPTLTDLIKYPPSSSPTVTVMPNEKLGNQWQPKKFKRTKKVNKNVAIEHINPSIIKKGRDYQSAEDLWKCNAITNRELHNS